MSEATKMSTGNSVDDSETVPDHIQLEGITKTYGDLVAVDDLSLNIADREFLVLLGPSGCGKTTTLRCIAGLEQPDEGSIRIAREDVTFTEPKDRDLSFVFQTIALFPHMTVRENIRFGLDMITDLSAEEKEEEVREAADILQIENYLDSNPKELSGGQQQRVALGRAMVTDPEGFLLDEPFSALDANLRNQMQTEIQRLQDQVEKSMVFVTHDQDEAMTLGDRIAIMNDGEIIQIGSPHEIYNEPNSLFVAQFIGSPSTNTFEGTIENRDGQSTVITDLFELPLTDERTADQTGLSGKTVTLGVRPGNIHLGSASDGLFDGYISLIEPQGDNDVIHFEANGADLRALHPQGRLTDTGAQVSVSIEPEDVWIFDESGNRLI